MVSIKPKSLLVRLKDFFARAVNIGASADTFNEDNHRIRLVNGASLIVCTMMAIFICTDALRSAWLEVVSGFVTIMLFSIPIILNYKLKFYHARLTVCILGLLASSLNILMLGTLETSVVIFMVSGSISCIIFPPKEIATTLSFLAVTICGAIFYLNLDFAGLSPGVSLEFTSTIRSLNLAAMMIILSAFFLNSSFETNRYLLQLQKSMKAHEVTLHQSQTNSRLAAVGELAAGLAHEINNPLAIISGIARRIHKKASSGAFTPEEVQIQAVKIQSIVDRISQITNGMLTFARQQPSGSPLMEFDAIAATNLVAGLFNELGKSQGSVLVRGNAGWVQQILLNLLSNAKYANKSSFNSEQLQFEIRIFGSGESVSWDVSDHGPGIPSDVAHRVMEPFFTTKPVGDGTGLGLSISKGLAQSMGGDLTIVSQRNPTTLRLTLTKSTGNSKSVAAEPMVIGLPAA